MELIINWQPSEFVLSSWYVQTCTLPRAVQWGKKTVHRNLGVHTHTKKIQKIEGYNSMVSVILCLVRLKHFKSS